MRDVRPGLPGVRHLLKDGKPQWQAQCYQCMRCINACPTQAIQYGKSTEGRRRYTIEAHIPRRSDAEPYRGRTGTSPEKELIRRG